MNPYSVAQQYQGMGRNVDAAKLNDFMYNGGRNLSVADRAWCADFVNATLKQSGMPGTGSGMARSFMGYGQPTQKPNVGDLAVFSRGNDNASGHVGFYQGRNPDGSISVLGGNQGGMVKTSAYPESRLLGYRSIGGGSAGPSYLPATTPDEDFAGPRVDSSMGAGRRAERTLYPSGNAFSDDRSRPAQTTWEDGGRTIRWGSGGTTELS